MTSIAGPRDPIVRRLRLRLDCANADENEITLLAARIEAEPEIVERTITKDDAFIVIATDGLWDVLSNQTVAQISCNVAKRSQRGVQEVAEALAQDAYAKGSTDNISVIVLDLRDGPKTIRND